MDLRKYALPAALLALVAVMAFTVLGRGEDAKTLTAHFPRAISVFEGSDVRVLGVSVGKVDSVTPSGTEVIVKMHYSGVTLPEDAQAIIVAPSIVGDRFVQLTPVFGKGDTAMEDGAVLRADRTSVPLELDQVYASLDDLNVALGPTGANKHGALSDLLAVTADNFDGQGKGFRQTIADFSTLTGTLDRNRDDLFGTAAKLQRFLRTLAENDQTVRQFNGSLARVSRDARRANARRSHRPCETWAWPCVRSRSSSRTTARAWGATSRASTESPRCWSSSATPSTRCCGSGRWR
jgi:phospholipid/cholesterol/gamma-HCH transport system substrate-binding protein